MLFGGLEHLVDERPRVLILAELGLQVVGHERPQLDAEGAQGGPQARAGAAHLPEFRYPRVNPALAGVPRS